MYNLQTNEEIVNRMVSNMSSSGVDTREGSFTRDMISSIAMELAMLYIDMSYSSNKFFLDTLDTSYLDRKCYEKGIFRKEGTRSSGVIQITGNPGTEIPVGTRIKTLHDEPLNFEVIDTYFINDDGIVDCNVSSLGVGSKYNLLSTIEIGLFDDMNGINSLIIKNDFIGGTNIETDNQLRDRYLEYVRTPSTSGNKNHYNNWAMSVSGVGKCKVIPRWNGVYTVKLIIADSNIKVPSDEIVDNVKDYIDSVRPVCVDVTVEKASNKDITVSMNLMLEDGYDQFEIISILNDKLIDYAQDISFNDSYVSIAKVGKLILEIEGVLDYDELSLNGESSNIPLNDTNIVTFNINEVIYRVTR